MIYCLCLYNKNQTVIQKKVWISDMFGFIFTYKSIFFRYC